VISRLLPVLQVLSHVYGPSSEAVSGDASRLIGVSNVFAVATPTGQRAPRVRFL